MPPRPSFQSHTNPSFNRSSLGNSLGTTNTTDTSVSALFESFSTKMSFDNSLHEFCYRIVTHKVFSLTLVFIIVLNVISVALQTIRSFAIEHKISMSIMDALFLAIYFVEFVLKIYALKKGYWANNYNKFDFFVLLISFLTFFNPQQLFSIHMEI
ncbi:hypothetical protein GEMRC1_002114 [Eukaryota sp. GEM-RC1]